MSGSSFPPLKTPIETQLASPEWQRWFSQLGTATTFPISAPHGGTGLTGFAIGDMLYANTALTLARLAGNTTTTKKFLSQTGVGSASAAPVWSALSGADLADAVIKDPGTPGRNLVAPTAIDTEGLSIKAFSSPVSIIGSVNWGTQGAGLNFGTTITQNSGAAAQTAYGYHAVANIAGLVVVATTTVKDDNNASIGAYACVGGIGISGQGTNLTVSPNAQSTSNAARGAWLNKLTGPGLTYFIGYNNNLVWDSGATIAPDTDYSFTTTITVGPNKGANKYDVTIHTVCAALGVDHSETITDGIDNGGTSTAGYICIAGSYDPAVTNGYSVSAVASGVPMSANAWQVEDASAAILAYADYLGNLSAASLTIGSLSGLLKATSGVVSVGSVTTSDIPEGSNLYYTNAHVDAHLSGTLNRITYVSGAIDISAAYVGQASITTVGTIATGTWNATAIADGKIASALTGKTYNALTLTALTTGFTIAGGTSSKTLTVPLDAYVSGTNTGDQTSVSGNAGTATALQTPRAINGVNFDGTAAITVTAASGTLTGAALAANVLASSLTSVGTLATLTVTATIVGSVNGNAATVTTNANLTGPITSVGNATAIASQTGTGTTFVMSASPTLSANLLFSATEIQILGTSADGSDTQRLTITATGAAGSGRGGNIQIAGNEHSDAGTITITPGSTATGLIDLMMTTNIATAFKLRQGANTYISVTTTTGSELITLSKNVSLSSALILSATESIIRGTSSDGSDNQRLTLVPGGAGGSGRGGSIQIAGNEHSDTGTITIFPGAVAGGLIDVIVNGSQAGAFKVRVGATKYIECDTSAGTVIIGVPFSVASATDATAITTGAMINAGGMGIAKALWVGGLANIAGVFTAANVTDATSASAAGTVVSGGLAIAKKLWMGNVIVPFSQSFSNVAVTVTNGVQYIGQTGTMSASRVVTLPAANLYPRGSTLTIADESGTTSATNTLVITRAGSDTINGATTLTIGVVAGYDTAILVSDGTSKWTVLGKI